MVTPSVGANGTILMQPEDPDARRRRLAAQRQQEKRKRDRADRQDRQLAAEALASLQAEALASLQAVLGTSLSEAEQRQLLVRAGNNVESAINLYYENPTSQSAVAGPTAAVVAGAAPALPGPSSLAIPMNPALGPQPVLSSSVLGKRPANPAPAQNSAASKRPAPLAERMRPTALDELLGQADAMSEVIQRALAEDRLPSIILWGPPGSGKTSFAHVVSKASARCFRELSAARSGVNELRNEIARAQGALKLSGQQTILFVDEIHRWSKAQQDALLHPVEKGTLTLIAATTENPSFSLNNALVSRCQLLVFQKIPETSMRRLLLRALRSEAVDPDHFLNEEAFASLCAVSDGDARVALNALELMLTSRHEGEQLSAEKVREVMQRRAIYDRNGDQHYDLISAVHKSLRGGSVDAALYYVARMLNGGEDPRYVTRRLIRFASEDIGLADPTALSVAVAADHATAAVGMPECQVCIAQAVAHLALAPKSCAIYRAMNAAMAAARDENAPVPVHIRNAPTALMHALGHSEGYVYNPSNKYERGCEQGYLPRELSGSTFFNPDDVEGGHVLKWCAEAEQKWTEPGMAPVSVVTMPVNMPVPGVPGSW